MNFRRRLRTDHSLYQIPIQRPQSKAHRTEQHHKEVSLRINVISEDGQWYDLTLFNSIKADKLHVRLGERTMEAGFEGSCTKVSSNISLRANSGWKNEADKLFRFSGC